MKLSSIASSIALVAGLLGVGVGGYNLVTTGCPLGSCSSVPAAALTPASIEEEHNCALGCSEHAPAAVTVAATAEGCSNEAACTKGEVCSKAEACCHAEAAAKDAHGCSTPCDDGSKEGQTEAEATDATLVSEKPAQPANGQG